MLVDLCKTLVGLIPNEFCMSPTLTALLIKVLFGSWYHFHKFYYMDSIHSMSLRDTLDLVIQFAQTNIPVSYISPFRLQNQIDLFEILSSLEFKRKITDRYMWTLLSTSMVYECSCSHWYANATCSRARRPFWPSGRLTNTNTFASIINIGLTLS